MIVQLKKMFEYNEWANDKIIEWSYFLDKEKLFQDLGISEGNYIKILAHIIEVTFVWRQRLIGKNVTKFHFLDTSDLDIIKKFWEEEKNELRIYIETLTEEKLNLKIIYTTTYGNTYENFIWEVLIQMFNHSCHHRSQLKYFLYKWGVKTENIDFMTFIRKNK